MNSVQFCLFRRMLLLFSGVVLLGVLQGCTNDARPRGPQADYRLTMTECEGADNCARWTFLSFNGWKGSGKWGTGEDAVLTLESPKKGKIIVHRADVGGSKDGLTATYDGTLRNGQIEGIYTYSYKGYKGSGQWRATLEASVPSFPPVMHFCDVTCSTLQLESGRYVSKTSNELYDSNWTDIWTVISFNRESAIFHRRGTGKFTFDVDYKGWISRDGNSLIALNPFHGQGRGQPAEIMLAWGDSLNTVPGSNAERDRARGIQRSPSPQATSGDAYKVIKDIRDGIVEIVAWVDFFALFFP